MATATKSRLRRSTSSRRGVPAGLPKFRRFAAELKVENGSSFTLLSWQRTVLWDYFDGARETVIIVPKKNGKSTLIAALALYHLLVTPNAECIIVAASREQAEIILRQARMFIRQSTQLQRYMHILQRSILSKLDEGRVRVLASDADTADGTIPTLAIVDELHRQKSLDLYGVLRDGLGPRNGQLITISTAGAAIASPLGEIRSRAHALSGFKRKGKHNYVRRGAFAFHEWCLDPDDDTEDLAVVKLANPAPWNDETALRVRRKSESMSPGQWLRFACGIWTEGEEPWIDPQSWDRLADPDLAIEAGEEVWLGVDVGVRGDSTAIAIVAKREGYVACEAHILPAPVSLDRVEQVIKEVCRTYQVQMIAYDPWSFRRSAELLESEGLPIGDSEERGKFPQSQERMSQASACLFRLIETEELRHSGDLALRAHVLAGVTKETERGWRLQKDPRARRPIDALIALAMAVYVATTGREEAEPMYVPFPDEPVA